MSTLARTTLAIDSKLLKDFDGWMARRGYSNRPEAVRDLIREALTQEEWADPKAEAVAVLSIIYDHDSRTLSKDLTSVQHEEFHSIICSQHVHLDHHKCLEVILLRGTAQRLRNVANAIISMRGVHAAQLTPLSKNL
jgi:CopG family transcriptional regulator, nickel-responsive regulator